jgi:NodT family efflux transporter outer membrane factor (OMF) lipoprotein
MKGSTPTSTRSRFRGAASLVSLVLALGGCKVGPKFATPDAAIPKNWIEPNVAKENAENRLWWKVFADPTLDHLVELAYHQNPNLQVAGLRIIEARAELGIVTGRQFPQTQVAFANASAVGLPRDISAIGNLPRNYFGYQAGFDVAWEADLWGKYGSAVDADAAAMLATVADYQSAIVSLTAEVARTYVVIRTSEVLVQQAQDNVKIQEQALQIAQARFKNGETSELDPTQATTLLETTRASVPQRQLALQQARNALATLLGQPTDTLDALLGGPKAIPKAPPSVAVGVPAEVLRRRPDIRSAELNAASQCARIGVAKADLYPSFSLAGTVGLATSTRGTASANLFSSQSFFYQAGPQINWKFLNYARITNAVRVEDARFQQLLVGFRNAVLKAAQEVEDALSGFLYAQQATVFQTNAVASAQRAVDLSMTAYREGTTDFQRVLDAQRSVLQQENDLADTTSSIATNLIALYKALGGGWEVREGDAVVPQQTLDKMNERTDWGDMLAPPPKVEPTPNTPPGKH